jgi:hypothetical protein
MGSLGSHSRNQYAADGICGNVCESVELYWVCKPMQDKRPN